MAGLARGDGAELAEFRALGALRVLLVVVAVVIGVKLKGCGGVCVCVCVRGARTDGVNSALNTRFDSIRFAFTQTPASSTRFKINIYTVVGPAQHTLTLQFGR